MNRVRQATSRDQQQIYLFDLATDPDEKRQNLIIMAIAQNRCWVVDHDGVIAGYVILDHSFYGHACVPLLYVRSMARRLGVGTDLMQHIMARCKGEKLFTSTNQSNQPMQALLLKLGFVYSGFVDNLDENDPEIVYYKPLFRL